MLGATSISSWQDSYFTGKTCRICIIIQCSYTGLGFRPISDEVSAGALIWYQAANESNYRRWTDQLDKFLERMYITLTKVNNIVIS